MVNGLRPLFALPIARTGSCTSHQCAVRSHQSIAPEPSRPHHASSLGHRIGPAFTPRMASRNPAQTKPRPADHAKPAHRRIRILGACRQIQTLPHPNAMKHRRNHRLIGTEHSAQDGLSQITLPGLSLLSVFIRGVRSWPALAGASAICFSAAFWIARKTFPTSRSSATNSRSITLLLG
jgi:hypothetical protein